MHGYLMCKDSRVINGAVDRMTDWLDEKDPGFTPIVLHILVTHLSSDIDTVRKIAGGQNKEIRRALSQTTEQFSAWTMPDDHPDNKWLMEQH